MPGVPGVPEVPEVPKVLRVPRVPRVHGARRWLAAGGAGLALAASLLLVARVAPERVPAWLGGSDVDPRFAALVEAVGEQRYVEPRLTGGFRYGPLRSATRSGSGVQTANLALLAAAGELQKAADADPTPENLHAWGVAQLLLERYDDAVHTLRAVVGADPTAPRYRADLAAALAARAAHTGNPEDWQAALDAARLARGLEPSMAEALFTEALALEAIDRGFESQAAWQRYLRWDQDSEWAAEAQRRLGLRSDPPK
ncbi:MAG: hypothetical protein Q8L86_19330 [Vicinamibacterales bacterium]|nr:hypothetical protein [Vicinamibacterales bacterium]